MPRPLHTHMGIGTPTSRCQDGEMGERQVHSQQGEILLGTTQEEGSTDTQSKERENEVHLELLLGQS